MSDNLSINTYTSLNLRPLYDLRKLYRPGHLQYEFGFRTLSFVRVRFRGCVHDNIPVPEIISKQADLGFG